MREKGSAVKLRDYQIDYVSGIDDAHARGISPLAVAPTGAGKMTIAAFLARREVKRGGRVVFVCHLREIAEDFAGRARALGLRVSVCMPGHRPDPGAPVQVATVQSLEGAGLDAADLLIVDEAHHYRAEEWQEQIARIGRARMVGFTATPQRADGKGLGDVFGEIVSRVTYAELLAMGQSVPVRAMIPERRIDGAIAMSAAAAYLAYGERRPAFLFLRALDNAQAQRATLRAAGVRCELVTASTPEDERAAAVAGLKAGRLDAILNYGTMTEGVDVPRVSCVVIEQTCAHAGSLIQRVGRAMRSHGGKRDALVLDLSGATYKHGLPWAWPAEYSLGAAPIRSKGERSKRRAAAQTAAGRSASGLALVEATDEIIARGGAIDPWENVNWHWTNARIARELGCGMRVVAAERKRRGIKITADRVYVSAEQWDAVDWSKSNYAISAELGCHPWTVGEERKRRAISPTATARKIDRSVFDAARWDQSDGDIAEQLGVSKAAVNRERKRRGISAAYRSRKKLSHTEEAAE